MTNISAPPQIMFRYDSQVYAWKLSSEKSFQLLELFSIDGRNMMVQNVGEWNVDDGIGMTQSLELIFQILVD